MLTPQAASSPGSGPGLAESFCAEPPLSPRQHFPVKGSFRAVFSAAGHDARSELARGAGDAEPAPDRGSVVSEARPVLRPGWESRARAGRDPPKPPLFPWGPRPPLPPRSDLSPAPADDQCSRGQRRAQERSRWLQSLGWVPENSGKQNPERCSCSVLRGSNASPSALLSQAQAAVTNPISLSRNNSGPFQQPPASAGPPSVTLELEGCANACRICWSLMPAQPREMGPGEPQNQLQVGTVFTDFWTGV